MKYYLKLGFILLIFCAIASGVLAYINTLTAPIIAERKAREAIETRSALIPGAEFHEVQASDGSIFYEARDPETQEIMGYTFNASDLGYSSTVQTMVGVDPDFKVIAIRIVDQAETPGLGANCTSPSFTDQYKGLAIEDLYVNKDGGVIVPIAGATITSRCIANSIRKKAIEVRDEINQGGGE
nr:H+/Na+-translocating ferredoxin:NAD+ oxidoreductase subunit [Candidatus Cloacimonadota bacterium]